MTKAVANCVAWNRHLVGQLEKGNAGRSPKLDPIRSSLIATIGTIVSVSPEPPSLRIVQIVIEAPRCVIPLKREVSRTGREATAAAERTVIA